LADVKSIHWQQLNVQADAAPSAGRDWSSSMPHFISAFRALLLVPLFPLLGYYLLDQTGISQALVHAGWIPKPILGEGFGHVGLCFSLHYILDGAKGLIKGVQSILQSA
jgi:hypothetical protein